MFDIGRESVVNRAVDGIRACRGCLHDHIQGAVDTVGVVAQATHH